MKAKSGRVGHLYKPVRVFGSFNRLVLIFKEENEMRNIIRISIFFIFIVMTSACSSTKLGVDTPLVIMPMGDTITEGLCDTAENCYMPVEGDSTKGGYLPACSFSYQQFNPNMVGYRAFLRDQLTDAGFQISYTGSISGTEGLAHEAHGDFTIADLDFCVQNAGWLENTKPDMVLIHVGTVDATFSKKTPEEMAEELNQLIEQIYAKVPDKTNVLVAQILPVKSDMKVPFGLSDQLVNDRIEPFNAQIPGIADKFRAEGKNVYAVDMSEAIQSDEDFYDGLHPNPVALERMAGIWKEKIVEILNEP
jgi:lysophospholipase L1-like esterase